MTDALPSLVDDDHRLRFACACAAAVPTAEDPWVAIVNQRKLNDGTKELILNAIYRQPRTITQLAELLGISAPAVHRHVVDMLADELIQEVDLVAPQRSRGSERYYRPNFPVVLAADQADAPAGPRGPGGRHRRGLPAAAGGAHERSCPDEPTRPRGTGRDAAPLSVRHSDPPRPGAAGGGWRAAPMARAC